ncbi:MAG: hypothetical protein IIB35_09710 [Gemmatimonadetes bacterium]|nr:hypothetical protein [Gemmatimonadota bacterium]
MKPALLARVTVASCLAAAAGTACSSDAVTAPGGPELVCVAVTGEGATVGDRDALKGENTFRFGNEERVGQVSVYLFEMEELDNGRIRVPILYQFNWDRGDAFLTEDLVVLEPGPLPDHFEFRVFMTIVSGQGIFAGLEGQQPIVLSASIEFGPPDAPGDARAAIEEFELSGKICQ